MHGRVALRRPITPALARSFARAASRALFKFVEKLNLKGVVN